MNGIFTHGYTDGIFTWYTHHKLHGNGTPWVGRLYHSHGSVMGNRSVEKRCQNRAQSQSGNFTSGCFNVVDVDKATNQKFPENFGLVKYGWWFTQLDHGSSLKRCFFFFWWIFMIQSWEHFQHVGCWCSTYCEKWIMTVSHFLDLPPTQSNRGK